MVLMDTGSTHNIMQSRIAHHLNLPATPITNFPAMVGNGSHLQCERICNNVQLVLQNKPFSLPFYLFPIEGAYVVLDMAWLRTLGPIQVDFPIPSITFNHKDKTSTLEGDPKSHPFHTSFHQLCDLIHIDSIAPLRLMVMQPISSPSPLYGQDLSSLDTLPITLHLNIVNILQCYQPIFQFPKGLPPERPYDHHITLLPNTHKINVKPYCYPHSQQEAMAIIIHDMLKERTIIPSYSAFSSPIFLVKKGWLLAFFMDYQTLKVVTIKYRYPIPMIDELLDELNYATIFSKIDLCSSYHQIRVALDDTHKTAFHTFDGHYEFLVMSFGLTNAPIDFLVIHE